MRDQARAAAHPPLRVTPWLAAKLLLAIIVLGPALVQAATPVERLGLATLAVLVLTGLLGTHELTLGRSRLPTPVQRVALGLFLVVAVAVSLADGVHLGLLGWALAVAVLFPSGVPGVLRRRAAATASAVTAGDRGSISADLMLAGTPTEDRPQHGDDPPASALR